MTATDRTPEATLQDLEARWCRAQLEKDEATLTNLLADSFTGVGHLGNVVDKAAYLQVHLESGRVFTRYETAETTVQLLGEAALLMGRVTLQRQGHGTLTHRYLAVWTVYGGLWRLLVWQDTPVQNQGV